MTRNNIAMAFLLSWLRKARSDQGGEFVRDSTGGGSTFSGCQAAEMSSGTQVQPGMLEKHEFSVLL